MVYNNFKKSKFLKSFIEIFLIYICNIFEVIQRLKKSPQEKQYLFMNILKII